MSILTSLRKRRYTREVKPFIFSEHEKEIKKRVNESLIKEEIKDPKGFTLVRGFIAPTLQQSINDDMSIIGGAYPSVIVVANSSGRMYQFALTHLFTKEELNG